ncbi:MAG: glycosyl hydrolase family 28-related protein [Saccharofermentanales bacterium]
MFKMFQVKKSVRSIFQILLITLLAVTFLPQARFFEVKAAAVFSVNDYGAVADGKTDSTAAIQAAINAAKATRLPSVVQFGSGEYLVYKATSNPKNEGLDYALTVNGITDCVIQGSASSRTTILINNPSIGGFRIDGSTNLTLKNLTFDYAKLPYTQGTIVSSDSTSGKLVIDLDDGYIDFNDPHFSPAVRDGTYGSPVKLNADKNQSRFGPEAIMTDSFKQIEGRRWQINVARTSRPLIAQLTPGSRYIQKADRFVTGPIVALNNKNIEIDDITVYASGSVTTMWGMNDGIKIRGLNVTIKPDSDRLISVNADGIHAYGNRGGMLIENCSFYGMMDDGINMHSRAGFVSEVIAKNKIKVNTSGTNFYRTGDSIQIVDTYNKVIRDTVKLTAVYEASSYEQILTLERNVDGVFYGTDRKTADTIYNTSACSQNSIIQNNTFYPHRGRHILFGSHDVTVQGNIFNIAYSVWTAVELEYSNSWGEGPAPYNINIKNNTFNSAGALSGWNAGINFSADTSVAGPPGHKIKNINIENNTFNNVMFTAMRIIGGSNVMMKNNVINVSSSRTAGPTILIDESDKVEINGLTGTDPNKSNLTTAVIMLGGSIPKSEFKSSNINYTLTATSSKPVLIDYSGNSTSNVYSGPSDDYSYNYSRKSSAASSSRSNNTNSSIASNNNNSNNSSSSVNSANGLSGNVSGSQDESLAAISEEVSGSGNMSSAVSGDPDGNDSMNIVLIIVISAVIFTGVGFAAYILFKKRKG